MNRTNTIWLILIALILNSTTLLAQNKPTKSQRKEQRELTYKKSMEEMMRKIESGTFEFTATEISSTGKAAFSNIKLRSLWYVRVTPKRFTCYLPIYGTSLPTAQPTLRDQLNIFTSDYEMKIENNRRNLQVVIDVKDDNYSNKYTFRFSVTASGRASSLTVSSNFKSPVTFKGNII